MSDTTFSIEAATTGRAACKKCKQKIPKGELRLGKEAPGPGDFTMKTWFHPTCFTLPRNLTGMTAEQFVDDLLEDAQGDILPARKEELVAAIAAKPPPKKKSEDGGDPFIAKLAAEYKEMNNNDDDDDHDDKKKKKRKANDADEKPTTTKKAKKAADDDQEHQRALELYGEYHAMTGVALKEILKCNRQVQSGVKEVLLHKVIDGALHGRLARCYCTGRLKLNDTCTKVACLGSFDEDMQVKIPCDITYSTDKAPRFQPWFTEQPTEEETEAMDKMEAVAKGEDADVDDDSDLGKLMKEAEGLELDLSNKPAIKASAAKVVELLENTDSLDLPEDAQSMRMTVGQQLISNKEMSAVEHVKVLAKQFGFRKAKAEKSKAKESAIESSCDNPANAPLLLAFDEIAQLYFKEQNKNAGGTYKKVVKAIKDLSFEVTEDNAKSLGKSGKNKVAGVGKSTADKMHEFLSTGKIEKLEELRQNAA